MLKRNVDKRLEQLEKVLLPPKPREVYEIDPRFLPRVIVLRPGDKDPKPTPGPENLIIRVIDTRGPTERARMRGQDIPPDPEPDDGALEAEIEKLERRKSTLKDGGGRP